MVKLLLPVARLELMTNAWSTAYFYVLRTDWPWRDLPERYGPYTTIYTRFNLHLVESTIVRAHQHAVGRKERVRITLAALLVT